MSRERLELLNLGCGQDIRPSSKREAWTNLDHAALPGVDVVWDLERGPWPFEEGRFDGIIAFDIWEHLDGWWLFVQEAHRILKVGGQIKIRTCAYGVEQSFRDPDHRRWATRETFCYWTPGHWLHEKYPHYGGGADFRELAAFREGDNWVFVLEKLERDPERSPQVSYGTASLEPQASTAVLEEAGPEVEAAPPPPSGGSSWTGWPG